MLISSSETEAFPCVMTEALALGLPIVANDCPGGIREILSSEKAIPPILSDENVIVECGVMTPFITMDKNDCTISELSREEKMFAQGICNLLENGSLRNQLSQNAVIRSEDFSQKRISEKWINLLELL